MHILHISTIKEWRGGDAQMLTTHGLLEPMTDVQQTILCQEGSVLSEKCRSRNINYYTAPLDTKLATSFRKKIKQVIRDEQIDIVHVHDSRAFSLILLIIGQYPDVKLVYSRKRNNPIAKNIFKRIKYNHKRVNKIVCVSNAVRDVFKGIAKDMDKVVTLYDSIDVSFFVSQKNAGALRNEYHLSDDTLLVGNIAGLTPQKDLFTFIDTAELILQKTNKKVKFVIVGDGELKEELQAYCKRKNIEEHIIFAGFRTDVPQIFSELSLLLMTSKDEGLPLTIYEAFAVGVPVVTTKAGGIAEAVIPDETGYLTEIKDKDDLAEGVLKVLNDGNYAKFIVQNARNLVKERFDLPRMRNDYYELYKSL
ncbi:glycosyltransferase family 4 protein [Prolixibacter sp. NT017]|uniref:glycosyltransferase family 4 protein n=1 Tax=Prolixibacter sp. NT017 TaxID=2652390 RepID=UPI0012873378|nr:glycosyltransferase family 4 protein [Prolixibacter sp. NT017]GET24620.1 glycosyl transferase [Prolixibacter sp. NT017]